MPSKYLFQREVELREDGMLIVMMSGGWTFGMTGMNFKFKQIEDSHEFWYTHYGFWTQVNAHLTCRVDKQQDVSIDRKNTELDGDEEVGLQVGLVVNGVGVKGIQILWGQSIGVVKNIIKTDGMIDSRFYFVLLHYYTVEGVVESR